MANLTIETAAKTTQTQSAEPTPKISVMGVGVKIAIPTLLDVIVVGVVSWFFRPMLHITKNIEHFAG